jgi:hypothetical protein
VACSDWRVRADDLPVGQALADEAGFLLLSPAVAVAVAARRRGPDGLWDLAVTQSTDLCRAALRYQLGVMDTLAGGVFSEV